MKELDQVKGAWHAGGRAGFSMLELIAALSVISIGLLGVLQSYDFGVDRIRTMREASVAARASQDQIEILRGMAFADLTDQENGPFAGEAPDLTMLVNGTPSLTIRSYSDPALRLKEVVASVRWTGENGRTMKSSASTLIADKEFLKR